MKKRINGFWIFYFIWVAVNLALLLMAIWSTSGDFIQSIEKYWPFSVGLQPGNFLELFVYLIIPLLIYFLYRFTYRHNKDSEVEQARPLEDNSHFE
jgi:hypothetical protein